MHPQSLPKFSPTPQGILLDGKPLTKAFIDTLPPQSLRYLIRASELLLQVKPEDWDDRTPYDVHNIPPLVKAYTIVALAEPVHLDKYSPDQPRVPVGNPDGGQWTSEGGDSDGATETHVSDYEEMAHTRTKPERTCDFYIKRKQDFVDAHLSATEKAAKELHVPVENILGIAALESEWGDHHFALEGNNFFGLHYPARFGIKNKPDYPLDISTLWG